MLLDESTVGPYLIGRGLVPPRADVVVQALGGGVSNVVLAVDAAGRRMVVKQALPKLRVADEWRAKRERALTEAAALRTVAAVSPGAVPPVLDVDPGACAITITRAPGGWTSWKQDLLAGEVDDDVAHRLGEMLAAWHGLDAGRVRGVDDPEAFEQLRVDPYYRTVARRAPELAPALSGLIDGMAIGRRCLVHGDFSPKNVLVGPDAMWVIDFEVAHLGDPAFDIAFLTSHLVLKAVRRPELRASYARCAARFWSSYRDAASGGLPRPEEHVLRHLGALLVARIDGKSPVEYLADDQREEARALGRRLLLAPPRRLEDAWTVLERGRV